ncbi:ABC transporter ATP-binding protein [Oceanobacillus luteolus]|uniref:ABC transporter ATP-binding protein n=1 Tax=Oceanobacillus luteolus TaxID=1274358 RepID=UPI00203B8095|nr:ABC transporter ATP-binding protein [Oceanobacillus luteolus]MCM3739804.1 ABC transporter ATP-binding protein [Oceanobacillus luteolus]
MFLSINNVQKSFPNQGKTEQVLRDINLNIEKGEFVSLLGPSGCGKSTVLNIIAGLLRPSEGELYLDNQQITKPGNDRGMVFQQAALFPWLSVEENVMFPLKKIMKKQEARETAQKYLQLVQLSAYANHSPHELSGGMQQRVAIARALAMSPRVLLMDEPFGALDEQTRIRLHDELERIWVETKKTIIFVTHSIQEAIKLSDRIIVMGTQPGRILQDIPIDIERPREKHLQQMAQYEEQIMKLLKNEIDKVAEEELKYAVSN